MNTHPFYKISVSFVLTTLLISAPFAAYAKKSDRTIAKLLTVNLSSPLVETTVTTSNTDTTQSSDQPASEPQNTVVVPAPATETQTDTPAPATTPASEPTPAPTPSPVFYIPPTEAVSPSSAASSVSNTSAKKPVASTTATSTASSTFQGTGAAGSIVSGNIYATSQHLSAPVSRTLLELALVFAVTGLLMVQGRSVKVAFSRVWG